MKTDQQQTNTLDTNKPLPTEAGPIKRHRWGLIMLLSALLLGAIIASVALHFLAPTVPGRAESLPARVGWYLADSQWRADSRTFAAAWDYCLRRESEMPVEVIIKNGPVAATPTETLPKS